MAGGVIHRMPFGAEVAAGGAVRFRLWAPDSGQVALCIGAGEEQRTLPMLPLEGGWFETTTDLAAPGTRYRFRVDAALQVPDPASRYQPGGVNGPGEVIDPSAYEWRSAWGGRPWHEAVVYELHIGAFTDGGTFAAAAERLPHLARAGITAIEVMPVATFAGSRNWGYDGVLPFAPHPAYGRPDDFRAFIEAAQAQGIMVLLDVVYNHFGPEGNYLHSYASAFFTERHQTPWGAAINYDGPESRIVRDYFLHNALYWIEEYRLDGLRLDAVHAIADDSSPDILEELADVVQQGPGRHRHVHLVLENYANEAHYLTPSSRSGRPQYAAQWNDDFHHVCHTLLSGESDGYYIDYADHAVERLARCLREGFAYQGERSKFNRQTPRGERSGRLPLTSFIAFLQNHDQIGNRAFGERLIELTSTPALRAIASIMLLSPSVPALFMGEEFGCRQPFLYFADFEGDLAEAVREGRKREFGSFAHFGPGSSRELPDPIDAGTFRRSKLQWEALGDPEHREWLDFYRKLLDLRRKFIVPELPVSSSGDPLVFGEAGLIISWQLKHGSALRLVANLCESRAPVDAASAVQGRLLHAEPEGADRLSDREELPGWTAIWRIEP